ncbi:alkaline phosphatase family protein [Glutamicibacter sp. MNS18]|uniref:alkaline phosphatase family protein n=1 Tax=Glutamicibacter sp. MNS18 TaxID=2989817 RepID=UPI0022360239|nr:nucleotide pyrophosphatase/phosphodiesterase family protein [Glutamicibacter sp. MNS18]MCW4464464.1 alkaline phosphatase family protein [Glutamicibacter sp. MNS18]
MVEQHQPSPATKLPPPPGYGRDTLAEVLPSAASALGIPGFGNTLNLARTRRVNLVMVDGLGWNQLKANLAHAPFLRGLFDRAQRLTTGFPSTTATSLSTLGTGLPPGDHGMLGYDVVDPARRRVVNQLGGWPSDLDPEAWQPHSTMFEQIAAHGLHVATVSLGIFAKSALTRAALRGPEFVAATSLAARSRATTEVFARHREALVYTYFNELDKTGHKSGVDSDAWRETLEELDHTIKTMVSRLPEGTSVLITGDHGMVDVAESQRFDYSREPELIEGVELTSGEPRGVQLSFATSTSDATRSAVREAWLRRYGTKAWVLTRKEAIDYGLFGSLREGVAGRLGDLMILACEPVAFYDGRRVAPTAFEMVGQHGSLTAAERLVPLLVHRT